MSLSLIKIETETETEIEKKNEYEYDCPGIKTLDTFLDIQFYKKYGSTSARPTINRSNIDFYVNSFFEAIYKKCKEVSIVNKKEANKTKYNLGINGIQSRVGHISDFDDGSTPLITIKIKTYTNEFQNKIKEYNTNEELRKDIKPLLLEMGLDEKEHTWFLWIPREITQNKFLLGVYNL